MAPDEILQAIVVFDDWESCQKQESVGSLFFGSQAMDLEI
jgi:adenylate cyclase